jgi:hypothetical protein
MSEQETIEKALQQLNDKSRLPKNCRDTSMYPLITDLTTVAAPLEQVPDVVSASQRSRKFGASFGLHIIPGVDKASKQGPLFLPNPPLVFIDADSLDDLEARLIYEVKDMIRAAHEHIANEAKGPKLAT